MGRSYLRRRLGALKWRLTEVWPAEIRLVSARRLRPRWAALSRLLPQLAVPREEPDVEVHMLCGEAQVDMGIWASWSFLRFLPGALFFLHSDGTLTGESVSAWRRIIPQLEFVDSAASEDRMHAVLAAWPHLSSWRRKLPCARQDIDYFLYGRKTYVLSLDSDVLCFKEPLAVIDALRKRNEGALWMKDSIYAYSMPESEFVTRYGPNATRVNGGFWMAPRLSAAEMAAMDQDLSGWEPQWRDHRWAPQTLLGAAFSRLGGGPMDPSRYKLGLGGHSSRYVLRHYPSPKYHRPRFFTEGIPAVLKSMDVRLA